MAMPRYTIACGHCGAPASLKVASEWSDGETRELKTYAIVCANCLATALEAARQRHGQCRTLPGETVNTPGIWELSTVKSPSNPTRRPDLEK